MDSKGQTDFPFLTFIGMVIAILFMGPIMFHILNEVLGGFAGGAGNISSTYGNTVNSVITTTNNLWDLTMILIFIVLVILMLVSSFFVDIHPAFMIIYILLGFFIFFFAPSILDATTEVYDKMLTPAEQADMTYTKYLIDNFNMIMMGIFVLSGIVIYGKYKLSQGGGGGAL